MSPLTTRMSLAVFGLGLLTALVINLPHQPQVKTIQNNDSKTLKAKSTSTPPPNSQKLEFFSPITFAAAQNESKSSLIDSLIDSKKPSSALKAYRLASDCQTLQRFQRNMVKDLPVEAVAEACGDITPLQIRQLDDWLKIALEAKVPGALLEKFHRGPPGYENQVRDPRKMDAVALRWQSEVVSALTEEVKRTGDYKTLLILSNIHRVGSADQRDLKLALAYDIAGREIAIRSSTAQLRNLKPMRDGMIAYASKAMTETDVALAEGVGKRLALECCKQ